jgi:hypothetical protein
MQRHHQQLSKTTHHIMAVYCNVVPEYIYILPPNNIGLVDCVEISLVLAIIIGRIDNCDVVCNDLLPTAEAITA